MVTETIDPTTTAYLVEKLGFPIAIAISAFGALITILMLILRSQIKRQEQLDSYYFTNFNSTLGEHNKSLNKIHGELANVVVEMRCVSTKIDTYVNKLDRHLEPKSVAYIFREDKIGKIKNIVEEIDVTKDIERKVLYNKDKIMDNKDNNN